MTGVRGFLRWLDLDAPDWMAGAAVVLATMASMAALLVAIAVLAFAFRVAPWLGWFLVGAIIWHGPVALIRYIWRRYRADTAEDGDA